MTDKIKAPWTDDQVKSLNEYQVSGVFHPFTCICQKVGCRVALIAINDGWRCANCDYTQDWCWSWMCDWSWQKHWTVEKWAKGRLTHEEEQELEHLEKELSNREDDWPEYTDSGC